MKPPFAGRAAPMLIIPRADRAWARVALDHEEDGEATGMTDVRFEDEYETLHGLALARALRVVGNNSDAEEIAQETMLRAYSSWSKVSTYAEAWTTRVATNLAITQLRRQTRQRVVAAAKRSPEPCSTRVDIAAALETLPPRQRQVAVLRHVADLPEEEVANTLGISVGSVKRHLHRATTTLKSSAQLAVYNKAAGFRQQAIQHRQWLIENIVPAPEPPGGWPGPPWDTVAVFEKGYVRYRAADQHGDLILDAEGREVDNRYDNGRTLFRPFAHDRRWEPSILPWDSLDDAARQTVRRAQVIAERFGQPFVCHGALGVAIAEHLGDPEPLRHDALVKGMALEYDGPHAAARVALFAEREAADWRRPPRADRCAVDHCGIADVLKNAAVIATSREERATCHDLIEALLIPLPLPPPPPPPKVVRLMGFGRTGQLPMSMIEELDAVIDGTHPLNPK